MFRYGYTLGVNISNHMTYTLLVFVLCTLLATRCSGQTNRPPEFLKGGDMDNFSLREDTPVGSSVYRLRAADPEGRPLLYYISGDVLSVEREAGVVRLVRPLDREGAPAVDVIVSVADQGPRPHTISVRREIAILDINDNPPKFLATPYSFSVEEGMSIGTVVHHFFVIDADSGVNGKIKLSCATQKTPEACQKFSVRSFDVDEHRIRGEILVAGPIDYEERNAFVLSVEAQDFGEEAVLSATTNIEITIKDTQDQPPIFQNAPFTATVMENSPPGVSVLTLAVRDGDMGEPRDLLLVIENDLQGYFQLSEVSTDDHLFTTTLETKNPINRENDDILANGGLYTFQVKVVELVEGIPSGESSSANVTIVVGDVNDQVPFFNAKDFNVTISEDIGANTPLPGLDIIVSDMDVGDNAKFTLSLENIQNSEDVFDVFPKSAIGRTPVVIRVSDAAKLDYENPRKRMFIFRVISKQDGMNSDSATVTVFLSDANDHAPEFESDQFVLQVPENAVPGSSLFTLPAHDADSGLFGTVKYSLKGFGSDKFEVDPSSGEISVSDCNLETCLDFESQKSYSLTYEAQDGGGRVTTVNIFVEVEDVNDNAPHFLKEVYTHEVQENARKLLPPLYVKATDNDGPSQGGGDVTYSIESSNLIGPSSAIGIEPSTGEVILLRPIRHSETPSGSGLINVVILATDHGNPPLSSSTKLILKVKKENDGAPEFINLPYRAHVEENAKGGTTVVKIIANDPDGPDSGIQYFLHDGAKDNFVLDQKSGFISVAAGADLDRDVYGRDYFITVKAVDSGNPVPQTATATVSITVEDVNNKPPKFTEESYVQYITESSNIGDVVLTVQATDPDEDARLRYSIVEPISARDKTGSLVSSSSYNYKTAFSIDGTTGRISVNQALEYNSASVVILTVEVVDLNALDVAFGKEQKASVDASIYIRAHGEMNPVFSPPWTQTQPIIEITVPEESLIGSTLLTLSARDPLTNAVVSHFEKISGSDPDNYVSISRVSGVVALNRRLDFEALPSKLISFKVKAIIGELKNQRSSEATVQIHVEDINDNSPVFSQNSYTTSISESTQFPQSILTVIASDKDNQDGFGTIKYFLSGDGSDIFEIDDISGTISIRENGTLDRETQAVYNLQVTATDNPNGSTNQRRTSIIVMIKILDQNDNAPKFHQEIYTAVVPENVPTYYSIITVKATDLDNDRNGEVQYSIQDDEDSQSRDFFSVDPKSGVVSVINPLSGKGRSEPYTVLIRATDQGNPPLHSVAHLLVVVGDISTNDGVPQFIRPIAGEVAYIYENITVGTSVFQVIAFDPDNSNTANGKVAYKILDDQSSENKDYEFIIDAASGIITTYAPLDRERKENYTMIVVAHDFGFPPQEAHRVLRIIIMDVDDSEPQFQRPLKSQPIEIAMKEEEPIGTIAGVLKAIDNDTGINSVIDYHILNGNEDNIFGIRRSADNQAELILQKRIDRESVEKFTLTIKASKPSEIMTDLNEAYNYRDLSQTQVTIIVEDIDDNPPAFDSPNYVLGARGNTVVNSELLTLHASDPDSTSKKIQYSIRNVTFIRTSNNEIYQLPEVFHINSESGLITNNEALGKYVAGQFEIIVEASSSPEISDPALASVKIFVLQDRDLLKFVFYKRPNEVREIIPDFEKSLRLAVAKPLSLNVYDTNFYSRSDGSLDFESTSSCFQLLEDDVVIEPKKVMKILNKAKSRSVSDLYSNYSVVAIENCAPTREAYKMLWSEITVLVVAALLSLVTFVLCILICVLHSSYRRKLKRQAYFHSIYMTENGGHAPILSPAEQQRIYEWQEMNAPLADAASFRSYPTLR